MGVMTKLYVIMIAAAVLACCVSGPSEDVVTLSPTEFKELVDDNTTFVVDVRTPEDGHIMGTDAVIPYDQIKENSDKLPADKDTTIAVYCTSSYRSRIAARDLITLGYVHVYNLDGGIAAWQNAGLSVE